MSACSGDHSVHDNNNANQPVCGNHLVEPPEECDDGVLNSDVVPDACRAGCVAAHCGDGVADSDEACDGTDLAGQTCADVGAFDGGDLGCTAGCELDLSGCTDCGDGVVQGSEACDEGAANCDDDPGCLCATNCTLPGCGNGVVEAHLGEACDEGAANCDGPQCACSTTCESFVDACGFPMDGIWLEIDYTNAATVLALQWRFSETPGWGQAEWAPDFSPVPYIHDAFDNIPLFDDVIGTLAHLSYDGHTILHITYGLQGLVSYSWASVCIEGRSLAPGAPSNVNVYNFQGSCGLTTSIDPEPQVNAVGVDLDDCPVLGNNFQSIVIEPSGPGADLGVLRVRFTLHDAVY